MPNSYQKSVKDGPLDVFENPILKSQAAFPKDAFIDLKVNMTRISDNLIFSFKTETDKSLRYKSI